MRRLLPFALMLVACAKPAEAPQSPAPAPAPIAAAPVDTTPEAMAKAMDVPLYPDAEAPQGMSTQERRGDGSTHYSLVLATKDSPAKATAWYAERLKTQAMGGMVAGRTSNGNDVIVTAKVEAGRTLIRVKSIAYKQS